MDKRELEPAGLFSGAGGSTILLIGVSLLAVVQIIALGFQLPDEVPVHFDAMGNVDQTASRNFHLILHLALALGNLVMFLLIIWALPKLPTSMINMPNKEYWLAPERKESTIARTQVMLARVGIATALLFSLMQFLTFLVAKQIIVSIGIYFYISLAVYMVYVIGSCLFSFPKAPVEKSVSESSN